MFFVAKMYKSKLHERAVGFCCVCRKPVTPCHPELRRRSCFSPHKPANLCRSLHRFCFPCVGGHLRCLSHQHLQPPLDVVEPLHRVHLLGERGHPDCACNRAPVLPHQSHLWTLQLMHGAHNARGRELLLPSNVIGVIVNSNNNNNNNNVIGVTVNSRSRLDSGSPFS